MEKTVSLHKIATAILIMVVVFFSISAGAINIPYAEVVAILFNQSTDINSTILWDMRMPRVIGALLVGACLGVSGATMQAIFRNPLADPSIIGVTTGASLAIVLAIVFLPAMLINIYTMPIFAFIGAVITTLIVYKIGTYGGRSSSLFLVLGGIAISILAGTVMGFSVYVSDDMQLRQITMWQMGSLAGVNWISLPISSALIILGIVSLIYMGRKLDIYSLGEYECKDLGLNPQTIKKTAILFVTLSIGASIAIAGPIGFIGLVVPHIIRLTGSSANARVVPLSALFGGVFLLICDTVARTIAIPMDIPVGLVTGVPGGLLFILLLIKYSRSKVQV